MSSARQGPLRGAERRSRLPLWRQPSPRLPTSSPPILTSVLSSPWLQKLLHGRALSAASRFLSWGFSVAAEKGLRTMARLPSTRPNPDAEEVYTHGAAPRHGSMESSSRAHKAARKQAHLVLHPCVAQAPEVLAVPMETGSITCCQVSSPSSFPLFADSASQIKLPASRPLPETLLFRGHWLS